MNRITEAFLQAQVDRLNRLTGSSVETYVRTGDKFQAQVGNYHLSGAYGGHALLRMENESGGVSEPMRTGHISKRELSERISAFINGIESAHEQSRLTIKQAA